MGKGGARTSQQIQKRTGAKPRVVANGSIGGQGVTVRGNPTGQSDPCAPVVGGDGGCSIDAASELLQLPQDVVRGKMVAKLESMQAAYNGDSDWMGDVSGDRFHHNVLAAVARDLGYNLKLVKASEYATILSGEGSYFVYGTLNFDFQPYQQRGKKCEWKNQRCKKSKFYGLERIPNAHDAKEYHAVAIRNGELYCGNLVAENGHRFSIRAVDILPLAGPSKDGQYRVKGRSPLAYLQNISRVFQLTGPNESETEDESIQPVAKKAKISELVPEARQQELNAQGSGQNHPDVVDAEAVPRVADTMDVVSEESPHFKLIGRRRSESRRDLVSSFRNFLC